MSLTAPAIERALIGKFRALDSPPPGDRLRTFTSAVPGEDRSAAERLMLRLRVAWSKFAGRTCPRHKTCEVEKKPEPATVNVNGPLPAVAEGGVRLLMDGSG